MEYLYSFLNLVICRSITRAAQNLVSPDLLQSQAVDVRMELDLRIGKFIALINFKIILSNLPSLLITTKLS